MGRVPMVVSVRATSGMATRALRFAPSAHAEAGAWAEQWIQYMAALQQPRYLVDLDIDGGSDDEMLLMTLLFSEFGSPLGGAGDLPQLNVKMRTCYAAEAAAAENGLNALIGEAAGDADSNNVNGYAIVGCGQGHQFIGVLLTADIPP